LLLMLLWREAAANSNAKPSTTATCSFRVAAAWRFALLLSVLLLLLQTPTCWRAATRQQSSSHCSCCCCCRLQALLAGLSLGACCKATTGHSRVNLPDSLLLLLGCNAAYRWRHLTAKDSSNYVIHCIIVASIKSINIHAFWLR
jgi:hypothetical protein